MSSRQVLTSLTRISGQVTGQNGGTVAGQTRNLVTTNSGAFLSEPKRGSFVLTGVFGTVSAGLLVGALVSKNIASFLEENELFIPSDDDGDD